MNFGMRSLFRRKIYLPAIIKKNKLDTDALRKPPRRRYRNSFPHRKTLDTFDIPKTNRPTREMLFNQITRNLYIWKSSGEIDVQNISVTKHSYFILLYSISVKNHLE